jgi:hypothetical protein
MAAGAWRRVRCSGYGLRPREGHESVIQRCSDQPVGQGRHGVGADARDARRKLVRLTPLGIDALARSAAIFEDLRAQWAGRLGPERLRELEADLRTMTPHGRFRLDVPGWFGS